MQLELTLDEVKWAIVATKRLKIKHDVWFRLIPASSRWLLISFAVYHCYSPSKSITNIRRWPRQILSSTRAEKGTTQRGREGKL